MRGGEPPVGSARGLRVSRVSLVVVAGLATAACSLGAQTAPAPGQPRDIRRHVRRAPPPDWIQLDVALGSFVPSTVPGLAFLLTRRDETIFAAAYGDLTLDSVVAIASSTKIPSAVAIMTLADEGRLDVDEPVGTYLKGNIVWPEDKAAITTRMLLNHTSGVAQSTCLDNQLTTTLQACAQEIANLPLGFTPGTAFSYGGSSFQVAGYVAEVVSGIRWNDFFAQRVGTPLGLDRFTYMRTDNPRIAGGAQSDVGDYTRIMQMFLDGGVWQGRRILSSESVARMTQDQKGSLPVINSPGGTALPGYSFGWWISDPSLYPGSSGPELSDQGAFGCTPWIDLDLSYTAIILIQSRTGTGTEIWNAVRPLVIEQVRRLVP